MPAAGQRSAPFDLSVRLQAVPALCPNTMQPRPAELHKQIPLWVFPQMQGGGHPWTGSRTSVQIHKAVPPSDGAADWAFLKLISRDKSAMKVENSDCLKHISVFPYIFDVFNLLFKKSFSGMNWCMNGSRFSFCYFIYAICLAVIDDFFS